MGRFLPCSFTSAKRPVCRRQPRPPVMLTRASASGPDIGAASLTPKLAPVLRLTTRAHWPQEGSALKTMKISRPVATAFAHTPAESAEGRVILCRAEA